MKETEFMKRPEGRSIFKIEEFVDLATGRMIRPSESGLVLPTGAPLSSLADMTFSQAMRSAAQWWENVARFAMPDQRKTKGLTGQDYLCQYGMASNIILGYPWEDLSKDEKLSVLGAWWTNIGSKQ